MSLSATWKDHCFALVVKAFFTSYNMKKQTLAGMFRFQTNLRGSQLLLSLVTLDLPTSECRLLTRSPPSYLAFRTMHQASYQLWLSLALALADHCYPAPTYKVPFSETLPRPSHHSETTEIQQPHYRVCQTAERADEIIDRDFPNSGISPEHDSTSIAQLNFHIFPNPLPLFQMLGQILHPQASLGF